MCHGVKICGTVGSGLLVNFLGIAAGLSSLIKDSKLAPPPFPSD